MSRLERYISRELVPVFVFSTALVVFVFLLQTLLFRGPWLSTLPISAMGAWLWYQVPMFVVRAFPLSMVLAVLLVFGRLARENELLATRMAGLSLARVARPVVIFAGLLVIVGLVLAEFVVPTANERTKVAWWDSVDGGGIALAFIAGRQIAVGDYQLYFSGFDRPSRELRDVRIEAWTGSKGRQQSLCFAQAATLETIEGRGVLSLHGYACRTFDHTRLPLPPDAPISRFMTAETSAKDASKRLRIVLPQTRETVIGRNAEGGFEDARAISTLWNEWRDGREPANRDAGVELSTRTAWPFASLIVLLISIPLAASGARSTGAALGLALPVIAAYYLALTIGQVLARNGVLPALAGPWLANLLFLALGVVFIRLEQYR